MNLFKKILLPVILSLFIFSFSNYDNDCIQFKNGHFKYKLDARFPDLYFFVDRQDSIQIETKSGKYTKFSVKWTDDCTYEVKMIETTFNFPDSIQKIRREFPFITKIISWNKDYYIFKSSREKTDFVVIDTMWIVH